MVQQKVEQYLYAKYPGVLFQKEVNKYHNNNIHKKEFRVYFIGEKYVYMTSEKWNEAVTPENFIVNIENTYQIKPNEKIEEVILFAKKIINIIPKININDIYLKYILFRVDITYDNNDQLILSEIEFVPSLHVDLFNDNKMKNILTYQLLGNEIYNVTKNYIDQRKISKSLFDHNILIVIIIVIILIMIYLCYS